MVINGRIEILLFSLLLAGPIFSRPAMAFESLDEIELALSYSRQQLISGEFNATHVERETVTRIDGSVESSTGSWTGRCVFDSRIGWSLMQYRIRKFVNSKMLQLPRNRRDVSPEDFMFVSAIGPGEVHVFHEFHSFHSLPNQNYIIHNDERSPTGDLNVFEGLYVLSPIDPRCAGIVTLDEMQRGEIFRTSLEKLKLANMPARLGPTAEPVIEVDGDAINVVRFTQYGYMRRTNSFSTEDIIVPVSIVNETGMTDPETNVFSPVYTSFELNVTWEVAAGLQVPKEIIQNSYRQDAITLTNGSQALEKTETKSQLTFDWVQVNTPVSETEFDYHNFKLPDKTRIVDSRGDEHVILEVIDSTSKGGEVVSSGVLYWLRWSLAIFTALALAVVAVLKWRQVAS